MSQRFSRCCVVQSAARSSQMIYFSTAVYFSQYWIGLQWVEHLKEALTFQVNQIEGCSLKKKCFYSNEHAASATQCEVFMVISAAIEVYRIGGL